ncbi:RNA polymerase sigma factor [Adlercreutzia wanghongyangiae]|uniref:RNA polymerase sigma factor n=1 Tax=Adlercreutzia wanghongyangiae TaxID=3111451 RepID=UPI003B98786A
MLGSTDQADDVTQEAFIALYQSQLTFASDAHVRNWLLKVAANRCRNIIRSRTRHPSLAFDESRASIEEMRHAAFEQREQDQAQKAILWEHVERLPLDLREVIHLKYVEDLDTKSIAAICGISTGAVHARLFRARAHLRSSLKGVAS